MGLVPFFNVCLLLLLFGFGVQCCWLVCLYLYYCCGFAVWNFVVALLLALFVGTIYCFALLFCRLLGFNVVYCFGCCVGLDLYFCFPIYLHCA